MPKVSDLFTVKYGSNLELNRLVRDTRGVNFVSRTEKNNGVSARVRRLNNLDPLPAGVITVAGGGSVMASFLQPQEFYSGRDLYYLLPRIPLTDAQKIYYCACLRANKYRYNYGRQANRTLRDIVIPSLDDIPVWIEKAQGEFTYLDGPRNVTTASPSKDINTGIWKQFRYDELFEIKKGKRLTKAQMKPGHTPFISAIDSNNGLTTFVGEDPLFLGNTITVIYNGAGVAEAYYQSDPFWASDDVNVLYPKFSLNATIAMFLATLIRQEKYRFNYGRKWHLGRMKQSLIRLPVRDDGSPDWLFMEEGHVRVEVSPPTG